MKPLFGSDFPATRSTAASTVTPPYRAAARPATTARPGGPARCRSSRACPLDTSRPRLASSVVGLTLNAVYADGWDRGVVNPLTPAVAAARHGRRPVHPDPAGRRPTARAVVDVSWGDGYCGVARFDPAGRQIPHDELRATGDGDLFLRRVRTWAGPLGVGDYEIRTSPPGMSRRTG